MLDKIRTALNQAFKEISQEFKAEGVSVLMPTYMPQQGKLLSDFAKAGGQAYIAGGRKGMPAFGNVRQYGLGFDTSAYLNTFPSGMNKNIVDAFPDDLLKDRKIALFVFIPSPRPWSAYIEDRDLGTRIVATNEQDTRLFFERKGNLVHILEQAGLSACVIPSEIVQAGASAQELRSVYNRIKNGNGSIVVQECIENYEPTMFFHCVEDFIGKLSGRDRPFKAVRFVEGSEANLSFFVGNTLPRESGRGVVKAGLPEGINLDDPSSLDAIQAHAAAAGIDASNAFSVTGRATLKVVGEILLSIERCDSVGNNIGHVYDDAIASQIGEIGAKLGRKMALCGKVGLAGADLIIDREGKVWVNEINDRQQGPTDQMSHDAEKAGLPGLSRMAWFSHFADFSKERNLNILAALRDGADAIHQAYMKSRASFYIKMFATHGAEFNGQVKALKDVLPGVYTVRRDGDAWRWEAGGEQEGPVDLSSGAVTLRISHGGLRAGEAVPSGAEMFRILGVASGDNAPFVLENGISRLNPAWEPMIRHLYEDCFGKDYLAKNPMRKPGAPAAKNARSSPGPRP